MTGRAVIVGGGLGGLTAALRCARAGMDVTVCERGAAVGGRAATSVRDGFHLNLGPHALYNGGAAARELKAVAGLRLEGGAPPSGWALYRDELHTLPTGAVSFLTTGLLPFAAKRRAARLLARLGAIDTQAIAGVATARWLDENAPEPELRALLEGIVRVATYTTDFGALSAGAAIAQVASAAGAGVRYLDGGWQTLVDGLAAAARAARVTLLTHAHVTTIGDIGADGRRDVGLDDGRRLPADAVILGVGPAQAASLLPVSAALAAAATACVPVRAACLDVALRSLPHPRTRFALGLDRPLYFSVHSGAAKLAPDGGAVVHALRYLDGTRADDSAEAELEALLDRLQPGWRGRVVERRFLPRMIVAHDLPRANVGGLAARPAVVVGDAPGVYLAGDWVGAEGMLADAAVASAAAAARAAVERHAAPRAA